MVGGVGDEGVGGDLGAGAVVSGPPAAEGVTGAGGRGQRAVGGAEDHGPGGGVGGGSALGVEGDRIGVREPLREERVIAGDGDDGGGEHRRAGAGGSGPPAVEGVAGAGGRGQRAVGLAVDYLLAPRGQGAAALGVERDGGALGGPAGVQRVIGGGRDHGVGQDPVAGALRRGPPPLEGVTGAGGDGERAVSLVDDHVQRGGFGRDAAPGVEVDRDAEPAGLQVADQPAGAVGGVEAGLVQLTAHAGAAAVQVGLVPVEAPVHAGLGLAEVVDAQAVDAVLVPQAPAAVGARPAGPAAVHVELVAVEDAVRAGGRGAGGRGAQAALAVGVDQTVGAVGAGGAGAAAVQICLILAGQAVDAVVGLAEARLAEPAGAVAGHQAGGAVRAGIAGAAAIQGRLVAVEAPVVAGGGQAVAAPVLAVQAGAVAVVLAGTEVVGVGGHGAGGVEGARGRRDGEGEDEGERQHPLAGVPSG